MGCKTCNESEKTPAMQIVEGWANWIFPNKEVEKKAKLRALICATCSHNKANLCTNCNGIPCPIPTKTRSMDTRCVKWDKHENN